MSHRKHFNESGLARQSRPPRPAETPPVAQEPSTCTADTSGRSPGCEINCTPWTQYRIAMGNTVTCSCEGAPWCAAPPPPKKSCMSQQCTFTSLMGTLSLLRVDTVAPCRTQINHCLGVQWFFSCSASTYVGSWYQHCRIGIQTVHCISRPLAAQWAAAQVPA